MLPEDRHIKWWIGVCGVLAVILEVLVLGAPVFPQELAALLLALAQRSLFRKQVVGSISCLS